MRLDDFRGYVAATNGMVLSSGGIQNVRTDYVQRYHEGSDAGYHVPGLLQAVRETVASGKSFSEQGLPWATAKTNSFQLPAFTQAAIDEFSRQSLRQMRVQKA